MKKKKTFFILLLLIIIVIGVLLFFFFEDNDKYNYKIEKVTEINYNIINKEGKYGVINREGDVIVEPVYDIVQIPNPSKDIFVCMYEYSKEKKEYKVKVLNEKGEELYKKYNNIQAIPVEITDDGIPFEKTVLKYKQSDKYGLISLDGKKVTNAIYDQISAINYKEGMLLVKKDEKCGVINIKGKVLIPIEYETITVDNYYNTESLYQMAGFIVSKKLEEGYKYGYIDYKGKKILSVEYTEIERVTEIKDDKDIYLVALKNGQAGLLRNKEIVLNYEYEDIRYNSYNDLFVIQRNGKQGVANKQGEIKINTEYDNILFGGIYVNATKNGQVEILDMEGDKVLDTDDISKFTCKDGKHYITVSNKEIYKVKDEKGNSIIDKNYSYIEEAGTNNFIAFDGKKSGIVDIKGNVIIKFKYNSIFKIDGTNFLQANIVDTKTISLINESDMKILVTMTDAIIDVQDDYVKMYCEDETKYFDKNGKELKNTEVFKDNKLFSKEIDGKWGFVDINGKLQVKNIYDKVTEFNSYGFAGIKKDGKWGIINQKGEIIQEPVYTIKSINPDFIGKFYQVSEWYGSSYYTNKIE